VAFFKVIKAKLGFGPRYELYIIHTSTEPYYSLCDFKSGMIMNFQYPYQYPYYSPDLALGYRGIKENRGVILLKIYED